MSKVQILFKKCILILSWVLKIIIQDLRPECARCESESPSERDIGALSTPLLHCGARHTPHTFTRRIAALSNSRSHNSGFRGHGQDGGGPRDQVPALARPGPRVPGDI